MPRQLKIAGHLPVDDLERRYRAARDPVARSQWQIVWQLASGRRIAEVEEQTGYSDRWIREIASRYNRQGPEGIGDRRHGNRGTPRLLSSEQEAELVRALEGPAPDGGLWSGPKVAAWMRQRLGRPIHPTRGWEVLRRLAYRLGRPRPHHTAASPEAQAAFKGGDSPSR
ncbi:MAG TPA: winged helix-turn-helix domain-containing protein [Chloroflexota bacterium]|jgi:transposase|nr:winged helix-turn-helix domain-containing protein [Chloroflexota bacterium]